MSTFVLLLCLVCSHRILYTFLYVIYIHSRKNTVTIGGPQANRTNLPILGGPNTGTGTGVGASPYTPVNISASALAKQLVLQAQEQSSYASHLATSTGATSNPTHPYPSYGNSSTRVTDENRSQSSSNYATTSGAGCGNAGGGGGSSNGGGGGGGGSRKHNSYDSDEETEYTSKTEVRESASVCTVKKRT